MIKSFKLFALIALPFFSCSDNQPEDDEMLILQYIDDNNLNAQSTSSGLYYVINEPGTEEKPVLTSSVQVCYTGYFLDSEVFDHNYPNGVCSPITFPLTGVIDGWQEGIQLFGKGGKGILLLPSRMAYGSAGNPPNIPSNTVLAFDVHLIDFE